MRPFFTFMTALCLSLPIFITNSYAQPQPDVCKGRQSCFMAFDGRDRGFCEAYVEHKSCFMSFRDRTDEGWCQHLREGKSCFMALNFQARTDCEAGRIPPEHSRWLNLCRGR